MRRKPLTITRAASVRPSATSITRLSSASSPPLAKPLLPLETCVRPYENDKPMTTALAAAGRR